MKTELEDGIHQKLDEALSKIRLLTKEESEKVIKEQEEYERKYGLKALQKKVRKEFGLD